MIVGNQYRNISPLPSSQGLNLQIKISERMSLLDGFGYTGRPSGGHRSLGTLFDLSADITINPTTTMTFYGATVRGGGVQSFIYPAGGQNPVARFMYAELTKRF